MLRMKKEPGASTATTDDNIECVRDMVLLVDWLLMKWQIICKLVMVLPMNSSTIYLAFIKFVQDGSQNNSQCCINKHALTSANKIWITMIKKVTPSWTKSSLVTKHGSTITIRGVKARLWNGNIHNRPSGKISKANHQQENWCLQFFGTHKAQYWNIIRRGVQQ